MRILIGLLVAVCASAAWAEMDFVTDPTMCGMEEIDRYEIGMSFDGQGFWTIEYNCQLSSPIEKPTWNEFQTQIRAAYCEEPGIITPTVIVVRSFEDEPGVLYTYQEPTEYGSVEEAAGKFYQCEK